jgi:hypothetical protein
VNLEGEVVVNLEGELVVNLLPLNLLLLDELDGLVVVGLLVLGFETLPMVLPLVLLLPRAIEGLLFREAVVVCRRLLLILEPLDLEDALETDDGRDLLERLDFAELTLPDLPADEREEPLFAKAVSTNDAKKNVRTTKKIPKCF